MNVGEELLAALPLQGCVVTGDALWTQRARCQQIVQADGDYLFPVKENQPTLYADIQTLFADPQRQSEGCVVATDYHGDRFERRQLEASCELAGYSDWPGLSQVMRIEREALRKGQRQQEVVYAVTSLSPQKASPARLLALNRGHWGIENRLHYVRDVTFGEDASQVRTGSAPQVMAALRNTVIGLLRKAGVSNVAEALRRNAARPQEALALVGILLPRRE